MIKGNELDKLAHHYSHGGDERAFEALLKQYRLLINKQVSRILLDQEKGGIILGRSEKEDLRQTARILFWKMLRGDSFLDDLRYKRSHNQCCHLELCNYRHFSAMPMVEYCKDCKWWYEDREYAYERALFYIQSRAYDFGQKYHLTQHLRMHLRYKLKDIIKGNYLSKETIEFSLNESKQGNSSQDAYDGTEKSTTPLDNVTYDDLYRGIFPISKRKDCNIGKFGGFYYIKEGGYYVYDLYNKILQESEACIIKRIKKRQPYVWNAPCNWEEKTKFCGGVLVKGNILGRNQQKGKFATDFEHRAFIKKHYLSIGKDIRFYNEIGDVVTATHYKRPEVKSKPVKLPETSTECTKIDYGLHKAIRDYKDILKPMSENVTDGSNSCGKRYV